MEEIIKTPEEPKKKFKIGILILIIILALLAAAASFYIYEANKLQDVFMFNTTVNGEDISMKTVDEAKAIFSEQIKPYELAIKGRDDVSGNIKGEDIAIDYDYGTMFEDAKAAQSKWDWPLYYIGQSYAHYQEEFPVIYDEEKLEGAIASIDFLVEKNMKKPVDAKLEYSDDTGFVLTESDQGNYLPMVKVKNYIDKAIVSGSKEIDLEEKGLYAKPGILEDNPQIKEITDQLYALSDFEVEYVFGDDTVLIDRDIIWSWCRYDKKDQIYVDQKQIRNFVGEMANRFDTAGRSRQFTTTNYGTITLDDGIYGWRINQVKENKYLIDLVKNQKSEYGRIPEYISKPFNYEETGYSTDDIGDTYIEICITDQKMYYYEKGQLKVETDIVTGRGGRHTPVGVAYIQNHARNINLVGEDYVSFVKYWMKVWGGVGIHDASWRWKYGGNIYLTNGSHGCINTPLDNVIKLYDMVKDGTPVILYKVEKPEEKSN